MADNARPELTNIGLDLADIFPETVQLGDHDFIAVRPPVLPAGDYGPGHDDDQDSKWADDLSQASNIIQVSPLQCCNFSFGQPEGNQLGVA